MKESKEKNWALDKVKIKEEGEEKEAFRLSCAWNQTSMVLDDKALQDLKEIVKTEKENSWQIIKIGGMITLYSSYNFVDLMVPKEVFDDLKNLLKE